MHSLNQFSQYLKRKQFASSTIKIAESVGSAFFEWLERENLKAEQVTYNDLLLYMKDCSRKGAKQRTVQHYINMLKHYYDYLIEKNQIMTNPAEEINIKGVKRKVLYHILEPHELHQLYNAYQDETAKGKRNKAMLGLLIYQGVKSEELLKLETSHVKIKDGKIEIPGGKKSDHRIMELESHQVLSLYDYMQQARAEILDNAGKQTDQLFMSLGKGSSTISNFVNSFMKPLRAQHQHLKNAKQIRASVITKWLRSYNLREVQYLAGHRYISTTEGLKEEINQYHPL